VKPACSSALQSVRFRRLAARVTTEDRTLIGLASRSEITTDEVTPVSVRRSRLAVGHSLGFAVFLRRPPSEAFNTKLTVPLFEFSLRLELYPTEPSHPAAAGRLLSWAFAPFSTYRIRRSTYRRRSVPASFRPQGLNTLSTAYSLRIPAGPVSCRQRSWDSPFGAFPPWKVRERLRTREPTYRSTPQ
jgi:hypothetical protein